MLGEFKKNLLGRIFEVKGLVVRLIEGKSQLSDTREIHYYLSETRKGVCEENFYLLTFVFAANMYNYSYESSYGSRRNTFQGNIDTEAYLRWERKMEREFDCHDYSERRKVRRAVQEFSDHTIIWWQLNKKKYGERPFETWAELKIAMRKRFAPVERDRKEEYTSQRHVEQPSGRSTVDNNRSVRTQVNKEDYWM